MSEHILGQFDYTVTYQHGRCPEDVAERVVHEVEEGGCVHYE